MEITMECSNYSIGCVGELSYTGFIYFLSAHKLREGHFW